MKKKLLVLALPLFAVACGAAASSPTSLAPDGTGSGAAGGAAQVAPAQVAPAPAGPLSGLADKSLAAPSTATTTTVPGLPPSQQIELDATISVQVKRGSFDQALSSVIGLVTGEGGYLAGSQAGSDASDAVRSGSFTFQVPAGKYQSTLDQLRRLGKTLSLDTTSKNHSTEYVDLKARLQSAETQLDSYNRLLQKATSIGDILSIEQQIGQVQQQIEEYQGQLNYLDSVTQYSSITLDLSESGAAPAADTWGLGGALTTGLHNAASVVGWLITALATALPLLVLGGGAWVLVRRLLPRRVAPSM